MEFNSKKAYLRPQHVFIHALFLSIATEDFF